MIQTERLSIFPLSNQEIQEMIDHQTDEELRAAYAEMLAGCRKNPDQRIWHALWVLQLNDGSCFCRSPMGGETAGGVNLALALTLWLIPGPIRSKIELCDYNNSKYMF
ncbi:MAG TPA: hypothetical protein GXX34_08295 [Clostridia bacterium]|nr:hypothetical protein [Clostridia bacterium]